MFKLKSTVYSIDYNNNQVEAFDPKAGCAFGEFNRHVKNLNELNQQWDILNSQRNLESSLVIFQNLNQLEKNLLTEILDALIKLKSNQYFLLMFSTNQVSKLFYMKNHYVTTINICFVVF